MPEPGPKQTLSPAQGQRGAALPAWVDAVATINEYLDQADWRVNANANQGYSLGGMILNSSGKMVANYWLSQVYPPYLDADVRAALVPADCDAMDGAIMIARRNNDFHRKRGKFCG